MRSAPARVSTYVLTASLSLACSSSLGDDHNAGFAAPAAQSAVASADTGHAAQMNDAQAVYYDGDYGGAWIVFDSIRTRANARGDVRAEADAITWLGLTAMRQSRYDVARGLGESALALKLTHTLREDLYRSYNALGLLAQAQGRYDDALARFGQAASAARDVNNRFDEAKALGNQGLTYSQLGQLDRARTAIDTMRQAALDNADNRTLANALTNLAMIDVRSGRAHLALGKLDSARQLYRDASNPVGEENALAQAATAMNALGEPQRAIAYLDSALVIDSLNGLRMEAAENLQLKAEIFGQLGDHARALELLEEASAIAAGLSQLNKIADIARLQSHQYLELGDELRARRYALDALRLHGRTGAQLDALSDLILLAEVAAREGSVDHARAWIDAAEALATQLDVSVARGEVALAQARIADRTGMATEVLSILARSESDIAALGAATRWESHALRARALAQTGKLEAAVAEGRLAISDIERTRQRISSGPMRTSYAVNRIGVYADLVAVLLRMQRTGDALEVADAARGRALLEQLASTLGSVTGVGAQRLAESERLLRHIDWLAQQLHLADSSPRRDRSGNRDATVSIERELARARRSYEILLQSATRESNAGTAVLVSPTGVLPARTLREALGPTEALIEYFVTENALVTFVVTTDTMVSFSMAHSAMELSNRVHLADKLLRNAKSSVEEQTRVLRPLHRILIEPAVTAGLLRGKQTLIVVPHGTLVHLPFVALVDANGRYVGESYQVLTSPSASILARVRARPVAGPSGRHAVFAPLPEQLPGTREEASAVAARLQFAQQFIGQRATEVELRKQLAGGGHVHVATHGTLAGPSPLFSHLQTALDSTAGSRGDGRLEVHELLGMPVRSQLVFLSGCETGAALAWTNSFRRGEDYSTLSQAFLFAGAANVVATLWRIDDAGAAAFATAFYDALRSAPPVEALTTAQRQMMRHPRWSALRYWAGYTITGAGQPGNAASRGKLSVQSTDTDSPLLPRLSR